MLAPPQSLQAKYPPHFGTAGKPFLRGPGACGHGSATAVLPCLAWCLPVHKSAKPVCASHSVPPFPLACCRHSRFLLHVKDEAGDVAEHIVAVLLQASGVWVSWWGAG